MGRRPKKSRKQKKRRREQRRSRKLLAERSGPKQPIVERTETKGLVELEVPWVGGRIKTTWPATNRSVMVVICAMLCMLTIVVPACCYIIFMGATPENLASFGQLLGEGRKPDKVPVKTGDGIKMIEVCPPCPEQSCDDCMDQCPICPVCPTCPTCPAPTRAVKTAPLPPLRHSGQSALPLSFKWVQRWPATHSPGNMP